MEVWKCIQDYGMPPPPPFYHIVYHSEDAQMLEYWNTQPKVQLKCQVTGSTLQVYGIHPPVCNMLVVANTLILYFFLSGKSRGVEQVLSSLPMTHWGTFCFLFLKF